MEYTQRDSDTQNYIMVSEVVKLSNFQFLCWYLMIGVFCHCFLRSKFHTVSLLFCLTNKCDVLSVCYNKLGSCGLSSVSAAIVNIRCSRGFLLLRLGFKTYSLSSDLVLIQFLVPSCYLTALAQLDFGFIRKSSAVIMATVLKFYDPFNFTAPNLEPWSSIGVGPMASPVDLYIKGTRKEEEVIVGGLLSLLGREGIKIYDTLALSAANAKNIKSVLDALTEYFQPLKSEVFDQFLFHRSHQQPGEPFDV